MARKTHDDGAIEEGEEEEDSYSYEEVIWEERKSNAKKLKKVGKTRYDWSGNLIQKKDQCLKEDYIKRKYFLILERTFRYS